MIRRWWLRRRGFPIGTGTCIDSGVRLLGRGGVTIGPQCEVLRGTTLDGETTSVQGGLSIGAGCRIKENVWLAAYGGSIRIGERVLVGRNTVIHGHGGVSIGALSMLGPGVTILTAEHGHAHGAHAPAFQEQGESVAAVTIESNVWLGASTTVLPGVTIVSGVVVGAGAVVSKSLLVPGVYTGVPAKLQSDFTDAGPA